MWRKSRKTDVTGCEDIHHCCLIRMLDDACPLSLSYGKDTRGQALFDQACTLLNLVEKTYFGLRYTDVNDEKRWLEHSKAVYGQLKNLQSKVLSFRVKFYPSDPLKLKEEITKYQLFMQLRRDLAQGRLICPVEDTIVLAAHILHAEVGDRVMDEQGLHSIRLFPKEAISHAAEVINLQKELNGQKSDEAEEKFLLIASHLDAYGIDPQTVQDETSTQIQLGVSHLGISTFYDRKRKFLLKWSEITRLGYDGKHFIVFNTNIERKKTPCSFRCWSSRSCRRLWKYAVELQQFYTLESSSQATKVRSSGSLLRRHSTFKFRGKSEIEAFADSSSICRLLPEFRRSTIHLHSMQPYSYADSTSLPAEIWATDAQSDQSCTSSIANVELNVEPNNVTHDNSTQTLNLLEHSSLTSNATTPVSCFELPQLPQMTQTTTEMSTEHAVAAQSEIAQVVGETHEAVDEVNYIAMLELKQTSAVTMRMRHVMLAVLLLVAFFIVLSATMVIMFDVDTAASLLDSVFSSLSIDRLDLFEALRSFINECYTWLHGVFKYQ